MFLLTLKHSVWSWAEGSHSSVYKSMKTLGSSHQLHPLQFLTENLQDTMPNFKYLPSFINFPSISFFETAIHVERHVKFHISKGRFLVLVVRKKIS